MHRSMWWPVSPCLPEAAGVPQRLSQGAYGGVSGVRSSRCRRRRWPEHGDPIRIWPGLQACGPCAALAQQGSQVRLHVDRPGLDLEIADPDRRQPALFQREQVGSHVAEGPLGMPPAARLAAGSLAGTSQPDVQREAQHDTRRVGRQGGRTRSCDVLALVDLDDLASPVAVPHQRVETAAFAGASCGRTCPVRSPTIRLEQEILG